MTTSKKNLLTALLLGFVVVILFFGGCKKELSQDSESIKKPDLQMSNEVGSGKEPVLRQSPGLKFEVTSKTIERILPQLKGVEQIKAKLREGFVKKKTNPTITSTSEATFTATPAGNNNYFCRGIIRTFDGPRDWYLLNTQTWVFTYIGSTSNQDIEFYLDKPSVPGTYGLYAENSSGSGFTNYVSLGDPYVGVNINSGILEFTDAAAFNALNDRLEQAYEDHSAAFYDGLSSLTDEQVNDYAENQGFDDLLPLREFEAFWGFNSLRQKIESEISEENQFPETDYIVADEVEGTLINQYGQYKIGSELITELYMGGHPQTVGNCNLTFDKQDKFVFPDPNDPGLYVNERIWSRGVVQAPRAIIRARHTKPGGGSRRYATRLDVKISGNAFQNNCINYDAFDSGWKGQKLRKRLRVIAHDAGIPVYFGHLYFHTGHATGYFTTRGNPTSLAY